MPLSIDQKIRVDFNLKLRHATGGVTVPGVTNAANIPSEMQYLVQDYLDYKVRRGEMLEKNSHYFVNLGPGILQYMEKHKFFSENKLQSALATNFSMSRAEIADDMKRILSHQVEDGILRYNQGAYTKLDVYIPY